MIGVADDDPPSDQPPAAPERPARGTSREETAARIGATREMLGLGYAPDQVIAWLEHTGMMPDGQPKTWTTNRSSARKFVDRALESLDGEVAAPKNRKQARTRAMLTMMFQRAAKLAMDDKHAGKAAALITAAVAAADKIARIDGAYAFDGSLLLPTGIEPVSAEEAARIVAHAQATIELSQRRKALGPPKPVPPPVIDVTPTEDTEVGESAEIPRTPSGDAN